MMSSSSPIQTPPISTVAIAGSGSVVRTGITSSSSISVLATVRDVVLFRHSGHVLGQLLVTSHDVSFTWDDKECRLRCSVVDGVEKRMKGDMFLLLVKCKTFRSIYFGFPNESDRAMVASLLQKLSFPISVHSLIPVSYSDISIHDNVNGGDVDGESYGIDSGDVTSINGWTFYDALFEFKRFLDGELLEDGEQEKVEQQQQQKQHTKKKKWRFYVGDACPSYDIVAVIPSSVTNEMVMASASFRQGRCFPILSYCHDGAVIARCSQPLCGNGNNVRRSEEDEAFIAALFAHDERKYIIDTRSNVIVKTGGIEAESHYKGIKRVFLGLEDRHSYRESFNRIMDICHDTSIAMNQWLSKLDAAGWLKHLQLFIWSSVYISRLVTVEHASILIHGEEGVDSEIVVVSLAQLLMDPYYRTIRGFEMLIEREWLRYGHPFQSRTAQAGQPQSRYRNSSPIFLLFLDSVWQIMRQYATAFEFNEAFLIFLFEHAYSSPFGTFLANSQNEREALRIRQRTESLWSYFDNQDVDTLIRNPLYIAGVNTILKPSYTPQCLTFWASLYSRFDTDWSAHYQLHSHVVAVQNRIRNSCHNNGDMDRRIEEARAEVEAMKRTYEDELAELSKQLEKGILSSDEKLEYQNNDPLGVKAL